MSVRVNMSVCVHFVLVFSSSYFNVRLLFCLFFVHSKNIFFCQNQFRLIMPFGDEYSIRIVFDIQKIIIIIKQR